MTSEGEETWKVVVIEKEEVIPARPLQEYLLSLSSLDLLLPPLDVTVFFCYGRPSFKDTELSFESTVGHLKKSLSEALATYYPFAGRVVSNSNGELKILCNQDSVEFTVAYADVELKELQFYKPDDCMQGKLKPERRPDRNLAVQVTELKCGSVVVACTYNHQIADAYSANMFFVSWAAVGRSEQISPSPSFNRSILSPRNSEHIDRSFDELYIPFNEISRPKPLQSRTDYMISRIYYIPADQVNQLQRLASCDGCRQSKLRSLAAFLWKMLARSTQNTSYPGKTCKLGIVVDGRTRLADGDSEGKAVLEMASYFGNVLSFPYGEMTMDEASKKPLTLVAEKVQNILEEATKKEHFLGLIDWVKATNSPVGAVTKVFCTEREEGAACIVSSGQRFPVSKVDFGWGKPAFGSYYLPWASSGCGYVMPMPTAVENGNWVVYVRMLKSQVDFIESEASHVFFPFSFNCLV